jgi:succinate dehydrogenase / fumarate reductase iron-sulfur subunit
VSGVTLRVLRSTGFTEYEVEPSPGMTVLDALEVIRRSQEPGLRYRHSCHHGSCGTCAGLVNGRERLLCVTPLLESGQGPVTVEPLRKTGLIGDLAVDPSRFYSDMPAEATYVKTIGGAAQLEACIECGICVSACPVTAAFAGPAALAAADVEREKNPLRLEASLRFAAGPRGVAACESAFECSRACPQGVAPGRRIAALRRSLQERAAHRAADMGAPEVPDASPR